MVGRDAFGGLFSVLTRSEASWLEDYIRENAAEVYEDYEGLASMTLKDVILMLSLENEQLAYSMNDKEWREQWDNESLGPLGSENVVKPFRDRIAAFRAMLIEGMRIQKKLEAYAKKHEISYKKINYKHWGPKADMDYNPRNFTEVNF